MNDRPSKKGLYASIAGVALVALCCFTPVLVLSLAALGLGVWIAYLDRLLLPALIVLGIVLLLVYLKYRRRCKECEITEKTSEP